MKPIEDKGRLNQTIRIEEESTGREIAAEPDLTDLVARPREPESGAAMVGIVEDTDLAAGTRFSPAVEVPMEEESGYMQPMEHEKPVGSEETEAAEAPKEPEEPDQPGMEDPAEGAGQSVEHETLSEPARPEQTVKRRRSRRKAQSGAGERKKGGVKRVAVRIAAVLLFISVAAAGAYTYLSRQYHTVFFPNTVINGMDASGKRVEQVKEMIQSGMSGYGVTLLTREGGSERISGEEIGLRTEYDGTLENLLAAQQPLRWGLHYLEETSHTISTMITCDNARLEQVLRSLKCMDPAASEAPVNAYLSEYLSGTGYQIVPEKQGNRLIYGKVLGGVAEATMNLRTELSLEALEAYEKPEITVSDPELNAKAAVCNRYAGVTVIYQFGDAAERLDGDTIHTWLSENEYGNIILDEEQVGAYVKGLADKYNTAYKEKELKTSYGPTVTISRGNYGWRINQTAEAAALSEIIRSGTGQTREPIYSQMAASHGSQDYGDTYVEINLTAQHLIFYKNGSILVESDFVSGNDSRGWSTPSGAYPLTYKQRDATLKGEGYATPVSYWMPFNGGIGMHDAGWRSSFGGTIYKSGGSHGCVNLPPAKAKIIYENISSGLPILCYHLEGTQKGSSAAAPAGATEPSKVPAQPEAPVPSVTLPVPSENPQDPSESPAVQTNPPETPAGPSEAPETPTEPSAAPVGPAETPDTGHSQNYGPGGAPVKPDTGAVKGPGM